MRAFVGAACVLAWVAVALAGCASSPPTSFVGGVSEVPEDAASVAGDGTFPLRVRVVEEWAQGRPLVGAAVAVHLLWDERNPPREGVDLIGIPALGLRTDSNGLVTAYVEPGGVYSVVVRAAGWTQEYRFNVTANESLRQGELMMPVYRSLIQVTASGGFPRAASVSKVNQVAGVGATEPEWRVHELTFHESAEVQAQYMWRVAGVTLRLSWDNGVQEYGDLGVGVGFARQAGLWWYWDAATQMPGDGPVREDARVGHGVLINGRGVDARALLVGPTTGSGVVTADELDYELEGFVEFSAETVTAGQPSNALPVPGPAAWAGLGALAAGVVLRRAWRSRD